MKKLLLFCLMLLTVAALASCGSKKPENTAPPTTDYIPNELPQQTLVPDYQAPHFPDVGLYIDYVANASVAGTVEGGGTHRVDTKPAGTVKAVPKLGYRFVQWSDGVKEPVRNGDTVKESTQIVAIFDYAPLELPILHITTETGGDVRSKTEYINATLSLFNAKEEHCLDKLEMQIRGRGNKTWEYEKKSYKMKLSEKQSLLGLGEGKAKKWVLLANVCDQSLLRNQVSLLLADHMSALSWSPDSTNVEVFLNGEYRGVYLLCEEIDVNNNKIALPEDVTGAGEDIGFLVEISGNPKSPSFQCNDRSYQIHSDLSTDEAEAYQQQRFIEDYLYTCWEAVQNGDQNKIAQLIDIDSMVDAYLVEELLKNLDCGYDSFYLYRLPDGKLTFGPLWDFDNALGNADEGTENYFDLYVAYDERFQSNPWLFTIMKQEWFRTKVVARWDATADVRAQLSPTVLKLGKAGYNSFCRNFDKWKLFGRQWNRETEQITSLKNYTEHYEFLASWIDQRIAWLDEYYHDDTFIPDWDSTPINPENPGPVWPDWGIPNRPDWGEPDRPNVNPPVTDNIGNDTAQTLMENHNALTVDPSFVFSTINGNFGEEIECLFDNDVGTKFCCAVGRGGGWWEQPSAGQVEITFMLDSGTILSGYSLTTANDTSLYPERNPESWVLYAQIDDGSWVEIDASSADELGMGGYDYTAYGKLIENNIWWAYNYKLVITHAGTLQLSELTLYTQ